MSKLREAAQTALNQWDKVSGVFRMTAETEALRAALAQPEAEPPRDEWRLASEPPEDLRRRVIAWRAPPQRKSGTWSEALYDDGAWITRDGTAYDVTHWRDVTPPMEGA